ncbi:MAG: DUF4397 domain-containing protein [Planctomycetota bacterium]
MPRWLACILLILTALMPLSGCKKSSSDPFFFETTFLSVIHASDGGPIDLWVEGEPIAAGIQFGLATDYREITAGNDREIALFEAGTTRLLAIINPDLDPFKNYTLVLLGDFASPEVVFIEDDLDQADDDEFEIRAIHAAQAAGNVDVYITTPGTNVGDVSPTLSDIAFKAFTNFGSLRAGTYQIQITEPGDETVLYDSGPVVFFEDTNITLVVEPSAEGNRPLMVTAVDSNQGFPAVKFPDVRARIRMIHAISDNETLELLIDGDMLVSGLGFTASSGFDDIQSGDMRTIAVRQSSGSTPLIEEDVDIEALTDRTLVATNSLADPQRIWLMDDPEPPAAGKALLRLVHGASLAGMIDVYVTGEDISTLDPDYTLDFLDVVDHFEVDVGDVTVQITAAGLKMVLINESITLSSGDAVTAIGFDPPPGQPVPFTLKYFSDRP